MNFPRVNAWAVEWLVLQREKARLAAQEEKMLTEIETAIGPDPGKGTVTIEGEELQVKVRRRQNVTYDKERGAPHPLIALIKRFPFLAKKCTIDVKEKGSQIEKLLAAEDLKGAEKEACNEIQKLRLVKPGKSGIEIIKKAD